MPSEATDFDRYKTVVDRLFVKIDYLKNTRLRIPLFVAVANFALITLSTRADDRQFTTWLFTGAFLFVGAVGGYAMRTVWISFNKNVATLSEYYEKMGIPGDLAEPASKIWWLLMALIGLSSLLPVVLVHTVEFSSVYAPKP